MGKSSVTQYLTESTDLTAVANAIRSKGGTTDPLVYPDGFVEAISSIASSTRTQAKTVELSMASGDQVIAPDEGYSLSEATVTKPHTLIPENIKKDVDIGGVVGTMEGGGVVWFAAI